MEALVVKVRAALASALLVLAIAADARAAAPKRPAHRSEPSFFEVAVADVEHIEVAGNASVGYALVVAGVMAGYGLWFLKRGAPRRLAGGPVDPGIAKKICGASLAILESRNLAKSGVTTSDVADVRIFYEKWLNLGADERDAMREELRAQGIDMIKLGDALRSLRDAPKA